MLRPKSNDLYRIYNLLFKDHVVEINNFHYLTIFLLPIIKKYIFITRDGLNNCVLIVFCASMLKTSASLLQGVPEE